MDPISPYVYKEQIFLRAVQTANFLRRQAEIALRMPAAV